MKHISNYDYIVWDFNGTLLDDVAHGIACVNSLLAKRNMPTLQSVDAYHSVFCFPIEEYYRRLGLLDVDDYPTLAAEWVGAYRAKEKELPVRKEAKALLKRLASASVKQIVLSATEVEMLKKQLYYLSLGEYFGEILGRKDYYATDKSDIAIAWREAHPTAHVLMIGDTDHDLKAAQAAGFDCVLVAGGHQSYAHLQAVCADAYPDFATLEKELFA